jgi:hypothetical protein
MPRVLGVDRSFQLFVWNEKKMILYPMMASSSGGRKTVVFDSLQQTLCN